MPLSPLSRRAAIASAAVAGLGLAGCQVAEAQRREAHPRIRQAIRALEDAKTDLQQAAHDFGGHRADALRACDEAIRQLQLALNFDRR
ncbi:MAG: hypothetical protein ACREFQ_15920 [Stellaceae bacterium]